MMSSPLAVARSVSPDGALPAGAEHGLTHLHKQSSSSNLSPLACASPPGSPKSGAAATVCFHGASVPVTAEEAADLLAYLDREAVLGRSRAAVFLRRVAGCVARSHAPRARARWGRALWTRAGHLRSGARTRGA